MTQKEYIIHAELKEPLNGKKNHYFGSVSAMYENIPEKVIGVKATTVLRNLRKQAVYMAPGATIQKAEVIRKQRSNKVC